VESAISERRAVPNVIKLLDLARSGPIVGQVYQDAIIEGPGVVYLERCSLQFCTFEGAGSIEALLWPADEGRRDHIVGAIWLIRCSFVRCRFKEIGFSGTAEVLDAIRSGNQPTAGSSPA
jgi:hypothetical protein